MPARRHPERLALGLGRRVNELDALGAAGLLLFARRDDLLLNRGKRLQRVRRLGFGICLLDRLVDDGDQPLLVDDLHFLVSLDFELLDELARRDTEFIKLAVDDDHRVFDLAEGGGLGELDLLVLGDLKMDNLLILPEPFEIDIVAFQDRGFLLLRIGELIDDADLLVLLDR